MATRLFIIGNGFDLAHNLPTSYVNNFSKIAIRNEINKDFWDLYQSKSPNLWSDFENNLGHPDFNTLEEIFNGYKPDYTSEHESDRDAIITQVDINGNLMKSLYEFALEAEECIPFIYPLNTYLNLFQKNDCFLTFNYTHTLEIKYNIESNKICHIHGEVGGNQLIMGYPEGNYNPEKYMADFRQTGTGPFVEVDINNYIRQMCECGAFDYYMGKAYENLLIKTRSFYKRCQKTKLLDFINNKDFDTIEIVGHSCNIDFEYFKILHQTYPNAKWVFNPHNTIDFENVIKLINIINIKNYKINCE